MRGASPLGKESYTMGSEALVAERKLGDVVGREQRNVHARSQAATKLVAAFEVLAARYGMKPMRDDRQCSVVLLGQTVAMDVDVKAGQVTLWRASNLEKPLERVVPLVFDPIGGILQGAEIEVEVAPTPGELMPRKAALTVLVEEIVKLAEEK